MSDALRKWKRGDITVRGGKVLRFIEEELEGEKWEVVAALAASPADVVGEIVAYLNNHDPLLADAIASRFSTGDGWNSNMDEAPRDGTWIIGADGTGAMLVQWFDTSFTERIQARGWTGHYIGERDHGLMSPSRWRHLPPAPKGDG